MVINLMIKLDEIKPNPFQVRKIFDEDKLKDLSESIKTNGLLQPIGVRKVNDHYEIVFGERRYRATQLAGCESIECNLMDIDDKVMFVDGLVENIVREDIDEIEKANGLYELFTSSVCLKSDDNKSSDTVSEVIKSLWKLDKKGCVLTDKEYCVDDLCHQVGISPRRIVDYLKISTLDDDLKESFKTKTKRSVLDVNKFLTDMVKFVDDEREKIESEKVKEQKDFEAKQGKPMSNSLVGGQGGSSVHDHVGIDGIPLDDDEKYPNKAPDNKITNEAYIYQQYNAGIDNTESNKHIKAIKDIKDAYKEVGEQIDSKELSTRTKLAAKAPIELKAKIIKNTEINRIVSQIDSVDLLDDKEFVDKQIEDKPDERLLNLRIAKYQASEKEQINNDEHNKKSIENTLKNMIESLDKIDRMNLTIIEKFDKEQLEILVNKMKSTQISLNDKIEQVKNNES